MTRRRRSTADVIERPVGRRGPGNAGQGFPQEPVALFAVYEFAVDGKILADVARDGEHALGAPLRV